jgi:hypothetical protein
MYDDNVCQTPRPTLPLPFFFFLFSNCLHLCVCARFINAFELLWIVIGNSVERKSQILVFSVLLEERDMLSKQKSFVSSYFSVS